MQFCLGVLNKTKTEQNYELITSTNQYKKLRGSRK